MNDLDALIDHLHRLLGRSAGDARVVFSPLRVCPLGAHVDHQNGLVCGFALDVGVRLAFAPRDDDLVRIRAEAFEGETTFRLGAVPPAASGDWGDYARGAAQALVKRFHIRRGLDAFVAASLPTGGLGSSAAVGVAYLLALEAANELDVSPDDNIRLDRHIENDYLGLHNGILDQSMILLGERGKLTFMDCLSGRYERVAPASSMPEPRIVIAYSGRSDTLASTDYNQRVDECRAAAQALLAEARLPEPKAPCLRDVPPHAFERYAAELPPKLRKRATHFFTECERVQEGVQAWRDGDLERFGRLVRESGRSSIDNYECGRPELIALYEILNEAPGVAGARFSGAGFRGSCLGLAADIDEEEVRRFVLERYAAACPDAAAKADVFFCRADDGARLL